jgi:hypothetical protein
MEIRLGLTALKTGGNNQMAKTFKTGDLKEVGRVKVSAKGLREIANKLEQKTGSDIVINLMVYLTPGETPTDYPDLGYDFGSISTEAKKVEEAPKEVKSVEEAKPVVEETKKTEEKPTETPKAEEVKPATPASAETPKAEETPKAAETPAPTAEEQRANEIKEKAEAITKEANKSLSSETTPK